MNPISNNIIRAALNPILRAGFILAYDDGEDVHSSTSNIEDIMQELQTCDMEAIQVLQPNKTPKGIIFLLWENEPFAVISDYSDSLAPYMKDADTIANQYMNDSVEDYSNDDY